MKLSTRSMPMLTLPEQLLHLWPSRHCLRPTCCARGMRRPRRMQRAQTAFSGAGTRSTAQLNDAPRADRANPCRRADAPAVPSPPQPGGSSCTFIRSSRRHCRCGARHSRPMRVAAQHACCARSSRRAPPLLAPSKSPQHPPASTQPPLPSLSTTPVSAARSPPTRAGPRCRRRARGSRPATFCARAAACPAAPAAPFRGG